MSTDRPLIAPECAYKLLKGINAVIWALCLDRVVVTRCEHLMVENSFETVVIAECAYLGLRVQSDAIGALHSGA